MKNSGGQSPIFFNFSYTVFPSLQILINKSCKRVENINFGQHKLKHTKINFTTNSCQLTVSKKGLSGASLPAEGSLKSK